MADFTPIFLGHIATIKGNHIWRPEWVWLLNENQMYLPKFLTCKISDHLVLCCSPFLKNYHRIWKLVKYNPWDHGITFDKHYPLHTHTSIEIAQTYNLNKLLPNSNHIYINCHCWPTEIVVDRLRVSCN